MSELKESKLDLSLDMSGYIKAIEDNFTIVDKDKNEVPFILNKAQRHFMTNLEDRNVILKARKMGFSSVLLAVACIKFIFGKNERCVSMSFDKDASMKQLERAKHFIKSYERKNNTKVPFKYNSKNELVWEGVNEDGTTYTNALRIGTAKSQGFGRGDDITFLHLTEVSMADHLDQLLAGVGEAVVNNTIISLETTANGYNEFKTFWDEASAGARGYKPMFYSPEWEYDDVMLNKKRQELGRLFDQEFPMTPELAFIASGNLYFDKTNLAELLKETKEVKTKNGWREYRNFEPGEFVLVFADTAAGGGDFCAAHFMSKTKLDIPLVYHSKTIATEMTPKIHEKLEEIYDITGVRPVVAYERNNGGFFEMDRLSSLNRNQKYTIYRTKINQGTKYKDSEGPKLGWDTNSATRPVMLQMIKEAVDNKLFRIYDRPTINEMFSFVEVQTSTMWRAQAEKSAHDDLVMALAGVWQMYQTEKPLNVNPRRERKQKHYDAVTGRLLS
jgi:hypothetical protein